MEGPPVPWYRTVGVKAAGVVGGILLAVVTAVVVTRVNGWANPTATSPTSSTATTVGPVNATTTLAPSPTPTSSTVTPVARYTGPKGSGWSVGGTASLFTGNPLSIKASLDPSQACKGQPGWVFGQPARALAPLPFGDDADPWAVANGGVPASGSYLLLDVQSSPGQAVIVDDVGVRVVGRAPAAGHTWAHLSGGCGGLVPDLFTVDLDGPGGSVRAVAGKDAAGRAMHPVPFPHTLEDADPSEQWRIELTTTSCDCHVVPYLDYTAGGRTGRVEVTDRGGPWRVTATKGTTLVTREDETGRWTAYGRAP